MDNFPFLRLSAAQIRATSRKLVEAVREPRYPYPWGSLEEDLERRHRSHLPLVAYGSLLNPASAAETLRSESTSRRRPVIAFGARRLFNYEMPLDTARYGPAERTCARAALNVRVTGRMDDVVNGILVDLSLKEIPAMRMREVGYDLVLVPCLMWSNMEGSPFLAYIFNCPDEFRNGKKLTSDKIEPHREYYLLCREGAAEFGDEFLRLWLSTTYLADGVTPVREWEVTEFPTMGDKGKPKEAA